MAEPTIWVEIKANIKDFQQKMIATGRSLEATKKKYEKLSAGLMSAGRKMAFAGGAITGAMGLAVKVSMDYQKQLAQISTMLDTKSMPIMEKYKKGLIDLSQKFGESTETLSRGLYDILSASIAPAEALEVLAVAAEAAVAGVTDTGVAADAITTILNSYGFSADRSGEVSDKLFAIVKRGKITFDQLAPSIGKVAATAAKGGLSFEDLGSMIATITRAGIRAEEAMTAVNGVVMTFLKPTDDAAKLAKQFGLELSTATLKSEGMSGVLEKLKNATAEQLAVIFPNIRGLKGLMATIGDTTGFTKDYKTMLESAGMTQEAFTKQSETLSFQMGQLRQTFKAGAVMIGTALMPMVEKLVGFMKGLIEKFNNLSPTMKKIFAIGTALTGVFLLLGGGLMMIASMIVPVIAGLSAMGVALAGITAVAGPVVLAMGAIVGGIWAINKAIDAWEERRKRLLKEKAEERTAEAVSILTEKYRDLKKALDAENITQKEYEERSEKIREQIAFMTGSLEEYNKAVKERAETEEKAVEEATLKRLKLLEEERAKQKEFQEWLSDIRLEYSETHYAEERKNLEAEYKEALEKAKEFGEGKEIVDKLYAEKRKSLSDREHKDEIKAEEEFQEWVGELKEEANKVEYANKREELEAWHKKALEKAKGNQEAISLITQIYAIKDARMKMEIEKEFQDWLTNIRIEYGMSDIEAKKARLEEWHEMELTMAGENEEAKALIDAEYRERSAELFLEDLQLKAEKIREYISQIKGLFDAYYDYQATKIENLKGEEMDAAQSEYEARKKWIEENIKDENERATALGELEEGYQATKLNIKETYAEKEKAMRRAMKPILIAEAIANTAVAVTKALPNLILAGIIGIIGALQVAKIQATKYARGGKARGDEMALVGEEGPEIVRLPSGAEVYPAGETRKMLGYAEGLRMPDFTSPFEKIGEMIIAMRPRIIVHSADPATWIEELPADTKSRMWRRGFEEAKERGENL